MEQVAVRTFFTGADAGGSTVRYRFRLDEAGTLVATRWVGSAPLGVGDSGRGDPA